MIEGKIRVGQFLHRDGIPGGIRRPGRGRGARTRFKGPGGGATDDEYKAYEREVSNHIRFIDSDTDIAAGRGSITPATASKAT